MRALRRRVARTAALVIPGAAALAVALVTGVNPAGAVAHGTPAAAGQYRFAVKLTMTHIPRPDGSFYNSGCSASLIAPRWIITAGHCFHDVNRVPVSGPVPYQTVATIGRTDDADTTGHVVNVIEDYQSPTNDIAIAKLATPIFDILPLRLSVRAPAVDDILRIAGWGALDSVNVTPATHLQTGQVSVAQVTDTGVGVIGFSPAPDTSACTYDSGAPYFREKEHGLPEIVSVESDGPDCPHTQVESTSRVDVVAVWILSTIVHHAA